MPILICIILILGAEWISRSPQLDSAMLNFPLQVFFLFKPLVPRGTYNRAHELRTVWKFAKNQSLVQLSGFLMWLLIMPVPILKISLMATVIRRLYKLDDDFRLE